MKKIYLLGIIVFLALSGPSKLYAQLSQGGTPQSISLQMSDANVPTEIMPAFDLNSILAEDDTMNIKGIRPYRFGFSHLVAINNYSHGVWQTLHNGDRMWRLKIKSEDAFSINLTFSYYFLPAGATLHIYNHDRSMVIGAFTEANNQPDYLFATDLVKGDMITLEYYEPAAKMGQGSFTISQVTHAYRDLFGSEFTRGGFGSSGSCNMNVACPDGAPWADEIRGAVMLILGGGLCSGSVVNNTLNDGTPYILTANHCYGGNPSTWVFRFNWQSAACTNPTSSPTFQSLTGSTLKARRTASDFCLVQINNPIPANYNAFYSGWNNGTSPASATVSIHHPSGDIKKISFDDAPTSAVTAMGGENNCCWQVEWDRNTVTEGGSSGSPLFDPNHRIVGQLWGGSSDCANLNGNDYYGRFSNSWNPTGSNSTNHLKTWLDPNNSGLPVLDGYDPNLVVFATDAGLSYITTPVDNSQSCVTAINPVVNIRNWGSNPLTSVTVNYQVDNNPPSTFNWTGTLNQNQFQAVNLPAISGYSDGTHSFSVWTSNPNGQIDMNFGNDTAEVTFIKTLTTDAKAVSFAFPTNNQATCNATMTPIISIKNEGCNVLTSLAIEYHLNAAATQVFNWTGNLATGASANVTLPQVTGLTLGSHIYYVELINPNTTADQDTLDNLAQVSFSVVNPTPMVTIPLFYDVQTPSPTNWPVVNPNNNTTWVRNTTVGGYGLSTASFSINNFLNDLTGQSDYILSPYMNFTTAVAPMEISFDVAYAQYNQSMNNIDSLIVWITTNCGETWTRLYSKGGPSLTTIPGGSGVNGTFVPSAGQWRTELLNLNNFIGQADVRLRFENKSAWGNNMYLDNFNIRTNALSIGENEGLNNLVNIYPNPSNEEVNIEFKKMMGDENIRVVDLAGRIVFQKQLNYENKVVLSTLNWSNGVYLIEVQSGINTSMKKLIVQHP
jgi:lysyl endopeptidase